MKTHLVFLKALRQQLRDPLGLALTLLTTPAFVFFFWLFFGANPNLEPTVALVAPDALAESAEGWLEAADLESTRAPSQESAIADVQGGRRDAALVLREGESGSIEATLFGDTTTAIFFETMTRSERALRVGASGATAPRVVFHPRNVGGGQARTTFESYVPGLLVFSVIMLVFSTSMATAREVESGMLERLALTRLTPTAYLAGMSAVQALMGVSAVALTFAVAWALGFESVGSIALAVAVGAVAGLSCIAAGVVVGSLSRSVAKAFLVSSVVMFMLMLFSGVIYALPQVPLFELNGTPVDAFDILPTTHAVEALRRVLALGAGVRDIGYELAAMALLTALSFGGGVALFRQRLQGRPRRA